MIGLDLSLTRMSMNVKVVWMEKISVISRVDVILRATREHALMLCFAKQGINTYYINS
jgi:hypothetical protein